MESDKRCSKNNIFTGTLQNAIDSVIKKEGYVTSNVYKRMISTEGGNYLGELCEVDVKGRTSDGEKETNLFVKICISGDTLKDFFSVSDAYAAETYFYNELSQIYEELQDSANVPLEERYKVVKSYNESNTEAIILENVAKKGFKTGYRMDVMSIRFAEISVKQLAKFHGLSFVLQKLRPVYFNKKLKGLKIPMKLNEKWKDMVNDIINITIDNVDDDVKKKVRAFSPTLFEKYARYLSSEESRTNCVCHGDYRVNNILMKEIDGEITEVLPVDYQLIHYGCPVNDLIYLIFNSTDRQFRIDNQTNLKNLYYDTLDKFLQYFDINVEDIYPRKEFETNFNERLEYGLIIAIYCCPFHFVLEDEVPDFSKEGSEKMNFKLHSTFQDRIRGVFDDYAE